MKCDVETEPKITMNTKGAHSPNPMWSARGNQSTVTNSLPPPAQTML